jgi:putative Mg2+ transporter-C (MgtC) family protein
VTMTHSTFRGEQMMNLAVGINSGWSGQAALLGNLALAGVLGASVGAERQFRSKDAGMRTHALVALGAATFMLVSKFGFNDLVGEASVSIDPTRVAAQIVSGIGFLGGGLIFVRSHSVRGLTTASSVWLAAAIGMAAGSGILLVALAATAMHYVVVFLLPQLSRVLPTSHYFATTVRIAYPDRQGALREILHELTASGWSLTNFCVGRDDNGVPTGHVAVSLDISGNGSPQELIDRLESLGSVMSLSLGNDDIGE